MVQLCILSGSMAGSLQVVRRFPFRIGRAADNDLCFDATGVWDHHFMLNLQRNEGFMLETIDKALAAVNDHPQSSTRLKNGDVISFGSAKVQFWLSDPVQRGLRARELFFWTLLILVTLGQAALVYFLLGLG
jgi:pSer/pThr/pTyr-binding forkhead associated (FHA) protein